MGKMDSAMIFRFSVLIIFFIFQDTAIGTSCMHDSLKAKKDWTSIMSPNYPSPFAPQTQCTWRIWAGKNERIQLEFTHVDLARAIKGVCTHQWITIKDGLHTSETAPQYTLCGKNTPKGKITTRSNVVSVILSSDSALPENADIYTGINLRYSISTAPPSVPAEFKTHQKSKSSKPNARLPKRTLGSVIKALTPVKRPKGSGPPTVDGGSKGMSQEELNRIQEEKNRKIEEENMRRNNPQANIPDNNNAPPVDIYPAVNAAEEEYPTDVSIYSDENRVTLSLASTDDKKKSHTDGWIRPPPKGTKPMPHHTKVLVGIVGGILGAILLLILFKKCYWDKRKGEGDAYNSVRKFKDKNAAALNNPDRTNILAQSKEIETTKTNNPQSDDSGVSTGKSNTNKSQKQGVDNPAMAKEKRQPIEKPIGYMEEDETKSRQRRDMPRNNTFDVLQKQQYAGSDVDKWVSNTYDERIHRKRGDRTVDSNDPPPGYYDGMTPEEIEREKRRKERRRRRERRAQEERGRGGEDRDERGQKRNSGEERRHRRHRRR